MVNTLKCTKLIQDSYLWLKFSPWRSKILTENLKAENPRQQGTSFFRAKRMTQNQI